jgi:hypothetical protein
VTLTMVHPGGAPNTFVPSTEATRNMIVDYSRNVQSFALNKWLYIVPVTKMVGLYTKMTVEEAGRMLNSDARDDYWPLGQDAPDDRGRMEKFDFPSFHTKRYRRGFRIPGEVAEEASWDILAQHARIIAQHAMTRRTRLAATLVQTTTNWAATHTSAVTGLTNGAGITVTGKWDVSTTARLDIKKSLICGIQAIQKDTFNAVNINDIKLVIGPDTAAGMATSQEIADFVKGSPAARDYIGNKLGPNAYYGLPRDLYGVEIILEDAVYTSSRKGNSTQTKSWVWDGDKPALLYRAGGESGKSDDGLVGPDNSNEAPTFSTVTCFMKEEMTVESKYDNDNRVHKGRIVENFDLQLTSDISGFLFQDVLT